MANKRKKRLLPNGKKGSILLSVIWFLLILSGMLLSAGYPLQLQMTLASEFRKEQELRGESRDLLQLVIHRLQNDDHPYDAPGTMDFPPEFLEDCGYPEAKIELWDEGSRLNLNNTPPLLWDAFFQDKPEYASAIHKWFFQSEGLFATESDLARQNYFLCQEEIWSISNDEKFFTIFAPELTVFGPANFYLLAGETFLSLLLRIGEMYPPVTEMAIVDLFNQHRNNTMYQADLATLLSQFELPVIVDVDKLRPLIATKGTLNPNFISPRFLNALWGSSIDGLKRIGDLKERQTQNPFTSLQEFEIYLQNAYGSEIPLERTWLLFTLKTKFWGVKITLTPPDGPDYQLTAVLQREREDEFSPWQVKILSLQEKWL